MGKGQEEILYSHMARACGGPSMAGAFQGGGLRVVAGVAEGLFSSRLCRHY